MIEIIKAGSEEKIYIKDLSGEKTLLALLQEQNNLISAPCGGMGACGRCRVRFLTGVPAPLEKEKQLLTEEELRQGVRLACMVRVTQSCCVELWERSEEDIFVLTNHGTAQNGRTNAVRQTGYGVAIDIGTTTIAASLVDMEEGRVIVSASSVNHQRAYGADVIARIQASNEGKGRMLQASIQRDILHILEVFRQKANMKIDDIKHVVIVGNTTMCHLLRGLSCEGLGVSPFTPTDISHWEGSLSELLGREGWQARATILPGISAFIGADIVAGICAIDMDRSKESKLLLDIGTNGEMVLGNEEGLLATSAAAGPVFEGGNISCGVAGISGAISHVTLRDSILCEFVTIGNEEPIGICGTGIIDMTAELVKCGMVDENGTLADRWFEDGYPIAKNIRFSQRDIREVQMGKSAIRAGIETLLDQEKNGKLTICLAGGFGYDMDVANAIRIGLFPETFENRVKSVGNAALEGAKQYLLAEEETRERIEWIISRTTCLNLAEQTLFQELYMEHMFFKGVTR